jgi:hypothetical protein
MACRRAEHSGADTRIAIFSRLEGGEQNKQRWSLLLCTAKTTNALPPT